jgi:hypothetical protein
LAGNTKKRSEFQPLHLRQLAVHLSPSSSQLRSIRPTQFPRVKRGIILTILL